MSNGKLSAAAAAFADLVADASSISLCKASAAYDRSKSKDYEPDGRDSIDTMRGEKVYGQYTIDTLTIGDQDVRRRRSDRRRVKTS